MIRLLAIETSCDETACAVVESSGTFDSVLLKSSIVSSQIDLHSSFGGVVPEVASRAHLERIGTVTELALKKGDVALKDIDVVAATIGPGLIGALLVGVSAAKALAFCLDIPFVGVNHLEGHLFAPFLESENSIELPAIVLLVSGGHTLLLEMKSPGKYRLIGETVDDACGEAFDKVARGLGLGYPGGPEIDRASLSGDENSVKFPKTLVSGTMNFSFSGIKTSVIRYLEKNRSAKVEDVAASFRKTVVDSLIERLDVGSDEVGAKSIILGGGVAANSLLRNRALELGARKGIPVKLPPKENCTDNAAMIGAAGMFKYLNGDLSDLYVGANSSLKMRFQ